MAEKLLIAGGTGFIGSHLASHALKAGLKITVLSLNPPADDKRLDGVVYLQVDLRDRTQLQKKLLLSNFEYVVNLSGYINHSPFLQDGRKVIDTHFIGLVNLLEELDWSALKCFVQIGSSDEYGNLPAPQSEEMREAPISPYSMSKVASTQLLQMLSRTEGFSSVILRLFLVYGPGQDNKRFLPQIINGCLSNECFPVSAGEQLRDFCFVEDVVRGILLALKSDRVNGQIINLASGQPVTIRKMIELVRQLTGHGAPKFGELPYRIGENMGLYADIGKAKELLKWEPKISLEEGVRRTIHFIHPS
jgi:nucleoside-diphosphate-sugar epimerase